MIIKFIKLKKSSLKTILLLIIGLSLVLALCFYLQYRKLKINPDQEAEKIIQKIEKFMELPDEEPQVGTITDKEKLKDYPFFDKAQEQDKVLVFTQARKVILYRPSSNKIIEVAPLTSSSPSPEKIEEEKLKVTIYNGTSVPKLAQETADKLKEIEEIEIVNKTDAEKNDYEKSIVINLSGVSEGVINEIAQILEAEIASLPLEENKPKADILIIAGSPLPSPASEGETINKE